MSSPRYQRRYVVELDSGRRATCTLRERLGAEVAPGFHRVR